MNSKILPSSGISQQSTPPTIARQKTMHDFFRDSNIPNDANGLSKSFQHNFKHVFWYKFDEGFANPLCQVAGLVTIIFLFIGFGCLLIGVDIDPLEVEGGTLIDNNETTVVVSAIVGESLWRTWTYIADPGTHADVQPTTYDRLLGAFVGIGGIILSAMVIGLIVDGIKKIMEDLERGRGRVAESNHILVLGWTEKTVQVINQLSLMMESENGGTIVVVSDRAKKEAEAELRERCELLNSHLVVRTGNMMAQSDLLKYSVHLARSIIVLAPDGAPDKADAQVLRTVLSIRGLKYTLRGHIVAEMRDIDNTSLVELVGGTHVETVVSHDIVGRLMIQSARSRGLADVFSSILGFENDEIYVKSWPEFTGETFDTVLRSFDTCVPIGISKKNSKIGQPDIVTLNPPGNHVMRLSESIVVIAEDDDSYEPRLDGPKLEDESSLGRVNGSNSNENNCNEKKISLPLWKENKVVEKLLMTGWRRDIDDVIVLLDELVSKGSELHMLTELTVEQRLSRLQDGGLDPTKDLKNIKLVHHVGNPAVRRQLKNIQLWKFDSVLILADEALEEDMMHSDSNSLAILLLVRDLQLKDNSFHSRSTASERRKRSLNVMGAFQQSGLFGLPGSIKKKTNIKLDNNRSPIVTVAEPGKAGLKTMNSLFQKNKKGEVKQQDERQNEQEGEQEDEQHKIPPPPPPPKNALDMLESSPVSIGKTSIDVDNLQDSIDVHRLKISKQPVMKHTKSVHNARMGFLSKLKGKNDDGGGISGSGISKDNVETKQTDSSKNYVKNARTFDTVNLQKKCLVTVELLDPQTHSIIMQNEAISGMSDYVLSNNTVSKVLAMIAESREVKIVLRELLGSKGCDVSIYPLQRYVHFDNDDKRSKDKHSYWDLFTRVRLRNEILLGWIKDENVLLNPKGNERETKYYWKNNDNVVILTKRRSKKSNSRTRGGSNS